MEPNLISAAAIGVAVQRSLSRTWLAIARTWLATIALGAGLVFLGACDNKEPVELLISKATALRDVGRLPEAMIQLENALKQDQKNVPARLLAAQIYLDLGRADAALGILTRAEHDGADAIQLARPRVEAELLAHRYRDVVNNTEAPPAGLSLAVQASLLAYRAMALGVLGDGAAARSALERGFALDPHSVEIRIASGRLALAAGDIEAARRALAEGLQDAAVDRRLTQLDGDIAYAARDYAGAEQIYRRTIAAQPWNELARCDLAATLLAEDKSAEAIATLDAVLSDGAVHDPMLIHLRALAALRQKDYARAQNNAATVVMRVPGYAAAWLIAGAASYAQQQWEQAYYYLSPYVAQTPGDMLARKLLAAVQLQLERPGDADKTLSTLRDKAASDAELLQLIGIAAARSGDLTQARYYLGLALGERPDDPGLRTELGVAQIKGGDTTAGIDNLERVVAADLGSSGAELPLFAALMQTKQYDRALGVAEQMTKRAPDRATGQILAAAAYLTQGNLTAGRMALLRAREIDHGNVNANMNLAELSLADGKIEKAQQYYRDVLAAHPKNTKIYVALAKLEAQHGRPTEAVATLRQGVDAIPDDAALITALLQVEMAVGNLEQAMTDGRKAARQFPRHPGVLDALGAVQLATGQNDAALSTFKDLADVAPQAARAHVDLAAAYLSLYTPDHPQWTAINEATLAVSLDPHGKEPKLMLARALVTHSRFEEASNVVAELKASDPESIDVIELEGLVARGQGRPADAAAAFSRAIAVSDNAIDRTRLADAQAHLGHPDEAVATLESWVRSHADDAKSQTLLAGLYVTTGRLKEAREQYATLVASQPKNATLQNNFAWTLSKLGETQEALQHARAAVALMPQSADFLDTLGGILLRSGNHAEAIEFLDKAWETEPDQGNIGFHLSQALAKTGRKEDALVLLRRLLAGNGQFSARQEAQDLLRGLGG